MNRDLLITLSYFEASKLQIATLCRTVSLETFRRMVETEVLSDSELCDVDYIAQRITIWIDNNPHLACL